MHMHACTGVSTHEPCMSTLCAHVNICICCRRTNRTEKKRQSHQQRPHKGHPTAMNSGSRLRNGTQSSKHFKACLCLTIEVYLWILMYEVSVLVYLKSYKKKLFELTLKWQSSPGLKKVKGNNTLLQYARTGHGSSQGWLAGSEHSPASLLSWEAI